MQTAGICEVYRMKVTVKNKDLLNKIQQPDELALLFYSILACSSKTDQVKEHCWIAGLNTHNDILFVELVHLGGLNESVVDPRSIFKFLLLKDCCSFVICHNHPSGNVEYSQSDVAITLRLKDIGDIMKIKLLDHIIIGNEKPYYEFTSFAQRKLI